MSDAETVQRASRPIARPRQIHEGFIWAMLATAAILAGIVWVNSNVGRAPVTLSALFVIGSVMTSAGLVAGILGRRSMLWAASLGLFGIGAASLVVMTLLPAPSLAPLLAASGAWLQGPIPLGVGWPYLAMGMMMSATGLVMPFAMSRRPSVQLSALTAIRVNLWAGAFWQVAYVALAGHFNPLFQGAAGGVQAGIVASIGVCALLLSRGDRGWMRTLTSTDRSLSFSAYILPGTLVPVVGAFLTDYAARRGAYAPAVGPMLSIEISSISLMLVGLAVLRSLWLERRRRESLARALKQSAVIVHSLGGVIEYWPRGCEALYGFTAEEAIGQPLQDLLRTKYPVDRETILRTLSEKGEWSGELRQQTQAGKRVWVAARVVVDTPAGGGEVKHVTTLTDITDLKRTQGELEDTSDALSQTVAAYGLGIVDFDTATGITRFSEGYERILGRDIGSLERDGAAWTVALAPEDAARMTAWIDEDLESRASRRSVTIKVHRSDGALRDIQGMIRYRYSSQGRLLHVVGIYMDVTDQLRDRAEVEARGTRLIELQWELTHTSRLSAMGEMAAALAHELNQPLTAVGNSVGAISLILKDDQKPVDEKTRQRVLRAAGHAESQSVRAGEIVRRLREFISRGEADTQGEDLGLLIDDAIALALPNAKAVDVEIEKTIAPGASRVLADRIQIQQVLVNLIRNAVEAMREQEPARRVIITAVADDGMALISVCDTGAGVPDTLIDTLFAPFRSSKRDGMGVGLSICRRIVEAHGGKMWFEPAECGGACFKFSLPLISIEVEHVQS